MSSKSMSQSERLEIQKAIATRRDQKLTALSASDPGWQGRVEERKNKVAMGRLRVEKEAIELKAIEDQIRALKIKRTELELRISKKMPLKQRDRYDEDACPMPKSLCEAVASVCGNIHEAEMAKDQAGKKAIAIYTEYSNAIAKLALCSTRADVAASGIL